MSLFARAAHYGRLTVELLRLEPFDGATAEGRAKERMRRASLTALAAAAAKVLSIATALFTVPLTLHYLGTERYGMWMTMSSLVGMLAFADFGIGNGIMNVVAKAYGAEDDTAIREYVSSGLLVLSLIALVLILLFAVAYPFVSWARVFNVHSTVAVKEAAPSVAALMVCFAAAIPLSVIQRVQMAQQRGFTANLWQCASSLLALGCLCIAIWAKASLAWLALAFAGSPLIAAAANSIVYFCWVARGTAPSRKAIRVTAMKQIASTGALFFVLQLAVSAIFMSDNIIIAQVLGPVAVAEFSVPQRLFSTIPMLLGMVLAPLWPAYSEAIEKKDHAWVRSTLKRSVIVSCIASGGVALVMVLFANRIIHAWVGNVVAPTMMLFVAFGIWQVVQAAGSAIAMFLNGAHIVRFQVIFALLTATVMIVAKIAMASWMGASGVVFAAIISYVGLTLVPMYFFLRKYFGNGVASTGPKGAGV